MRHAVTLAVVLLLAATGPAAPAAAQRVRVLVDGQPVLFDQPPVVIGGRLLVPLRGVFERLGAAVEWDPQTGVVTALRGGTQVQLRIRSRQAVVDGRPVMLDVPALVVGGRTLVPLRFVSEAMGARVDWHPVTRTVFVTSGQIALPPPRPPVVQPPPSVRTTVVEGVVFRVDLHATPQRVFVQRDGTTHTFVVTPDTAITRVDVATGAGGAVGLDQVRPGDAVMVTADAQGRAMLIRVRVREVAGRIDVLAGRVIVLTDGRAFTLSDNARFFVGGRQVPRDHLRPGMEVTLRLNPQGEVTEVAAQGLAAPPAAPAQISSFTHDATKPLRADEVLTATLRGAAGGTATFDIFGVVSGVPMREVAPGVYQGSYTVRAGENINNAAVFGHLRVGGQQAIPVQAGTPVTIDTRAPAITQRVPEPNATVPNARPHIVVTFQDDGSGVDRGAVRLVVNGIHVTARATVTETLVAYNPPEPLSGRVVVQVALADRAGNRTEDRWTFVIGVAAGAPIRSVTVHPAAPLTAGQTLTVTMVGEPGGQAFFTIEGVVENVPMVEVAGQPGTYFGSYTVRPTDAAANARIFVVLVRGGQTTRAETSARVTIVGAAQVPPPVIRVPREGDRVAAPVVVQGTAAPGHRVAVRIDYQYQALPFLVRGTYGEVQTTADAEGQWRVSIRPSIRIPGAQLTITAVAVDPAGRRSPEVTVRVVQG